MDPLILDDGKTLEEEKSYMGCGNLAPAELLVSSIFCESIAKLLLLILLKTPETGFPC